MVGAARGPIGRVQLVGFLDGAVEAILGCGRRALLELVELAVVAGAQRRGVGAALHDAVLGLTERPHAVLSARSDATAALAFYAAKGWRTIHDGLRFPGSDAPFAVLVRDREADLRDQRRSAPIKPR